MGCDECEVERFSGFLSVGSAVQSDAKGTDEQVEQAGSPDNSERAVAEHVAASDGQPVLRSSGEVQKAQDEKQLVLKRILAAHEAFFDVHRDYEFAGKSFPGFAEFHSFGEQYVLVKRAKLWEANSHEYLFFTFAETFDEAQLDEWVRFMKERGLEKVTSEPNHMSSGLAIVVIADDCTEGARRAVRRVRFRKNFALGFRGWADLRVVVADLSTRCVYANAAGKQVASTIEANLRLA